MPAAISTLDLVALLIAGQELGRGGFHRDGTRKECWGDKNHQSTDSEQSVTLYYSCTLIVNTFVFKRNLLKIAKNSIFSETITVLMYIHWRCQL